eukprot:s2051_g8.t2
MSFLKPENRQFPSSREVLCPGDLLPKTGNYADPRLLGLSLQCTLAELRGDMSAPGKRRIGGHFGAALGASTKRQRGGWRDEVDEEDSAAGKAANDEDSEEAILDPGTPLPSDEEEAAEEPKVQAEPAEAAESTEAQAVVPAKEETPAPTNTGGETNKPVVFTLEVTVGKNQVGEMRVLLPLGLDSDVEQRLSACMAPDGGSVDFITANKLCGFGGHPVPGQKEEKEVQEGRMSTNRQEVNGATVRADMGAQYLSIDESDSASLQVADMLLSSGVCAQVSSEHLSATPERPKQAKHLAGTAGGAGATVHYEKRVASLDLQSMFDAVLVAVPGCGVGRAPRNPEGMSDKSRGGDNLLKIHGSWEGMLKQEQNKQLMAAQHDQRWSFAFFLPNDCQGVCERYFGPKAVESFGVESGPRWVFPNFCKQVKELRTQY